VKPEPPAIKMRVKETGEIAEGLHYYAEIECKPDTEILCDYTDGAGAAVTRGQYGKGAAIWAGTLICYPPVIRPNAHLFASSLGLRTNSCHCPA